MMDKHAKLLRYFGIVLLCFLLGFIVPVLMLSALDIAIHPVVTGIWGPSIVVIVNLAIYWKSKKH